MSVLSDIRNALVALRPAPPPCFTVVIGVVAGGAGYAVEVLPNASKRLRIKEVFFSKPSVQVTMRLIKASQRSAGGTSTDGVIVSMSSRDGVSAQVKLFTGAPTAGTAIGDAFSMVVAATDNVDVTYGQHGEKPMEIRGAEAFAVNVSGAATIAGFIRFEEVPD